MSEREGAAVQLVAATAGDAPLLENLLALYVYDLSDVFEIDLPADGVFRYDRLPLYFSEPAGRFAFLIRVDDHPAGFALVTRGSPMSDDPDVYDVAEFFVLRRHRRGGIGERAAALLFDRLPGSWVVRVAEANRAGVPFWRRAIDAYTGGRFACEGRPGDRGEWLVFTFTSGTAAAGVDGDVPATGDPA